MSDEELEERKDDLWNLGEVRAGGGTGSNTGGENDGSPDTSDTAETEDTVETEDTSVEQATGSTLESSQSASPQDTSDSSDRSDTAKSEAVSDTSDRKDREDAGTTAETPDLSDTDTSQEAGSIEDTADTTNKADPSDTAIIEDTPDSDGIAETVNGRSTVRQMAVDAEAKGLAVRDLHNVNIYLFETVYDEMLSTFKQLDAEYYAKHGEDLSKNKAFFNAVFRAGLNSPELREELELE